MRGTPMSIFGRDRLDGLGKTRQVGTSGHLAQRKATIENKAGHAFGVADSVGNGHRARIDPDFLQLGQPDLRAGRNGIEVGSEIEGYCRSPEEREQRKAMATLMRTGWGTNASNGNRDRPADSTTVSRSLIQASSDIPGTSQPESPLPRALYRIKLCLLARFCSTARRRKFIQSYSMWVSQCAVQFASAAVLGPPWPTRDERDQAYGNN
jgi:hypothetical protein